ncbi:endonuclease NucS domain-containing protein [Paraglaciecola arctica]|uniref:Endonuclease NucS C-terminal domain-containing protein n=1 Tax=Paraglaciecola arctica BSs20135 TaxID=493475 RepID=K6YQ90_9ALTE|nr:endonuclease NucS domain-containing protein [Paraglaciecola arctica]GAC20317.1 hypothetical protein GARC_3359 [Paraglaciecola arctica BSs20135]
MKMTEAEIRTLIAQNIKGFDPKLEVIEEEFKVEMDDGTRGFIDILARDEFGYLTIIELKKSRVSERSAIQQLFKYSAMLKEYLSISQEKIRRVIISTDWRELKAPFAESSANADYPIDGYKLSISNGQLNYEKVVLATEEIDRDPAIKFHLFKFSTQEDRNKALGMIEEISSDITELNLLVFKIELDQPKSEKFFVHSNYGFGLIVTFFACPYEKALEKLNIEPIDYMPYGSIHCSNNKLLVSLAFNVKFTRSLANIIDYRYELENLDSFSNYLSWYPVDNNYISFGKMFSKASIFMSKDDVLRHANGVSGLHSYYFCERFSTKNPADSMVFRKSLSNFLMFNKEWLKITNYLLNNLSDDDDVTVSIFNPLNVIALIHDYISSKESLRIPELHIEIKKSSGEIESYRGALMCEGRGIFSGVIDKIEETYGSIKNFKLRLLNHKTPNKDEDLSTILGLKHFVMKDDKRLIVGDGVLELADIDLKKVGLNVFFLDNIQVIDEVARLYDKHGLSHGIVQFFPEEF